MAIRVVSDYIFKLDDKYLRVRIGFVNSTSVIELFVCGVLAYYKPLFTEDIESDSDMKLIAGVVRGMSKDKPRWISNECAWIVSEFEEMIFHQRLTTYDFGCYEDGMYLTVIEDADKHVRLKLDTGQKGGKLSLDLDISEGLDIVDTADKYCQMLHKLVENFKLNRKEIPKATLQKNMIA